jgi:hypothetical protein
MNGEEQRVELQRQLLRSFKDGVKTTFLEEISNRMTYKHLLAQPGAMILHYTLFKTLTLLLL